MAARDGNHYSLVTLDNGVVSFQHTQTGEILHGQVGPEKEARDLYITASGLLEWPEPEAVIFDIGTGCGAQLLALLDVLQSSSTLEHLKVFSFDLEKDGLRAALSARSVFASVERHHLFLEKALDSDSLHWSLPNQKTLTWNFVQGDFQNTVSTLANREPLLRADFIFYDFFSPASHPWLWTFTLFEKLFAFAQQSSRFITYSSATSVKAALAAAGWYVGTTIASGKKAQSIFAAYSKENLENPLPQKFLNTFLNSHKPYCDAETPETRVEIEQRMRKHPQFCNVSMRESSDR